MIYTYHATMDNGEKIDVRADSAGEAIYLACHRMRGWAVKDLYLGGDVTPDPNPLFNEAGKMSFEIPKHEPLPADAVPGKQPLCARYIKCGDTIHHEGLSWRVLEITPLPVKIQFYCESYGGFSGNNTLTFHGQQILKVTRPEPVLTV